jgi:hypothetical protein
VLGAVCDHVRVGILFLSYQKFCKFLILKRSDLKILMCKELGPTKRVVVVPFYCPVFLKIFI